MTRSGGKAARRRRVTPTPYDRPPSSGWSDDEESPNWMRKIAEGAGRVMRSVLWSDSSSSSDTEASSFDDEVNTDLNLLDGNGENAELNEDTGRQCHGLLEWRSETKRAIVMLLMQETFSREECDSLIDIINSRNVDAPNSGHMQGKRPRRSTGPEGVCCEAVMEARKWRNERKLTSDSKSVLPSSVTSCNYSCGSSSYNTTKFGSSVEIARSYMCGRPLSPMESIAAYKTPPSRRMQSLWEGSPVPIRHKVLSSSEDFSAAVAGNDAEGYQSKVMEPSQETEFLKGASHVILSRRSLTAALDSQKESIISSEKPLSSVAGGDERDVSSVSKSNINDVGLCKFVSETSVVIPDNENLLKKS